MRDIRIAGPEYDNYDAINVNRTTDIPEGYGGATGVPITFLDKHNPDQFELLNADDLRTDSTVPVKHTDCGVLSSGHVDRRSDYRDVHRPVSQVAHLSRPQEVRSDSRQRSADGRVQRAHNGP